MHKLTACGFVFALLLGTPLWAQNRPGPENGKRYPRLAIRNAFVVDGNGTPMAGPKDIIIENNRIHKMNAAAFPSLLSTS